ncbi:hypothetical protein V2W49_21165, partial [Acinetobacter baumannii]
MQQKNPGRTLVLWIIAAHLFMGMVAYEWLPVSFRGSWIFILILLISGAFLQVGASLIVGLLAFIGVAVYFLLTGAVSRGQFGQVAVPAVAEVAPVQS